MKSTLEGRGYEVHAKWGKKSGSDILAMIGGTRLVIEAMGEGTFRQILGNYFLNALGEILQRMSASGMEYGIALPASQAGYRSLAVEFLFRETDRNNA